MYWTRFVIISTACELDDLDEVKNRLLENPKDFSKLFMPIFGMKAACRFEELLSEHLLIADELIGAIKKCETQKADAARKKWYKNADEIARFLHCVNRFWCEQKWKEMMYGHLEMTEKEATLRLNGKYAQDICVFNDIENEALKMADYMFCGIIKCAVHN